jgi:hypothetical protein
MPRKALLGAALVAATLGCVQPPAHAQVFGAQPAIESAQAVGTSRLAVLVSLPLPRMDSVTGDAAVKVNPGRDLAFDRLRVEVGALPVRGFELGNVKFL